MDMLENVINEFVTTSGLSTPTGAVSSRKRRANAGLKSNISVPAAPLSENASAIPTSTPTPGARSQRRATRRLEPPIRMPAAPLSENAKASPPANSMRVLPSQRRQTKRPAKSDLALSVATDEAIQCTTPRLLAPRRQKSRAVQRGHEALNSVDSAAGRAKLAKNTRQQEPDPPFQNDAGHDTVEVHGRAARVRRSDRSPCETHLCAVAAAPYSDDQCMSETQGGVVIGGDDGAQTADEAQILCSPVVAEIVQLWRMRQRWHRAEKSLTLQGKAVCRAWTAGDKGAASDLFDRAAKGGSVDPILGMALTPFLMAIENFAPERAAIEKRLRKLAASLPVYPWVKSVRGFGELNLAAIVGEAGEIGTYRGPACLWKRMGLAVIGGGRQRKIADAEQALIHGYNPNRRSVAYLLGETLIKVNANGEFKMLYDTRKAYELAREDEGKPKSLAHAHNRAARVMTKRALQRLWVEWRAADRGQHTSVPHFLPAPVGTFSEAAE